MDVRAALLMVLSNRALALSGSGGGSDHPSAPAPPSPAPAPPSKPTCLCIFDVDRTLTGQQKVGTAPPCTNNKVMPNINDTAYDGGNLSLSEVGQSIDNTFCGECYVGIVSAGDAGAAGSPERAELVKRLQEGPGKLPSAHWGGPSKEKEARRDCTPADAESTLVLGCNDGTKQHAVKGIVAWLDKNQSIAVLPENVWHFDDRENNIFPFNGTGFNARMVSCGTRDGPKDIASGEGELGLCGATKAEIVDTKGVALCGTVVELQFI